MPAPTVTGRSTPYQTFGALHDRTKEIIDVLTWRPFNTPRLIRADTTVAHKILNLHAADTADINRTRRAAFKTAHPDSLTGSPGFTSDQGDLGRCLEEAKTSKGGTSRRRPWRSRSRRRSHGNRTGIRCTTRCRRGALLWFARVPQRQRGTTGIPPAAAPQGSAPQATTTSGGPPPESPRARPDQETARPGA